MCKVKRYELWEVEVAIVGRFPFYVKKEKINTITSLKNRRSALATAKTLIKHYAKYKNSVIAVCDEFSGEILDIVFPWRVKK